jgi:hypothetical protein
MSSGIFTIRVATTTTDPESTAVEVEVTGGSEQGRAEMVKLVLLHLDGLWVELAGRIGCLHNEGQDSRPAHLASDQR